MCVEENLMLAGTSLEICTGELLRGQKREVRKSKTLQMSLHYLFIERSVLST
jgi:hypothetical protein